MEALLWIFIIFSWFVLGAAGSYIMDTKGRSQGLGFVLGFFLGAIGILIVLGMQHRYPVTRSTPRNDASPPSRPTPTVNYPNETIKSYL
jgi:hypothetical protein